MFPRSFLRGGLAGVLLGAGIGIAAFSTLAWLLIAIPLVVAGIAVAIRPPEREGAQASLTSRSGLWRSIAVPIRSVVTTKLCSRGPSRCLGMWHGM